MTLCVVGKWRADLDAEDRAAFVAAVPDRKRADLYALICEAEGGKPFGLTALKDHLNLRCVCN